MCENSSELGKRLKVHLSSFVLCASVGLFGHARNCETKAVRVQQACFNSIHFTRGYHGVYIQFCRKDLEVCN